MSLIKQSWQLVLDDKTLYFQSYLELIRDHIDNEWNRIEKEKKWVHKTKQRMAKLIPPDDPDDSFDYLNDWIPDLVFATEETSQLMYRSFVVSVFIFMESQITSVCEQIKIYKKQNFSYKDLSGTGIGRSIRYIELVMGTKFPSDERLRTEFNVARLIRNTLVHSEGELAKDDAHSVIAFSKRNPKMLSLEKTKTNDFNLKINWEYGEFLIRLNEKICAEATKFNLIDDF